MRRAVESAAVVPSGTEEEQERFAQPRSDWASTVIQVQLYCNHSNAFSHTWSIKYPLHIARSSAEQPQECSDSV
jgi:hypothetical protein